MQPKASFFSFSLDEEFFNNFTSEHTRKSYRNDLLKFFKYFSQIYGDLKKLSEIQRVHIINYRNYLSETGGQRGQSCAPKTIARKLACLSSYFHFLVEKGEIESNPVLSIKRPRRETINPTQALTREQVKELLAAIEEKDKPCRFMHKALLTLFFTTGLRKSEIVNLKFCQYREINDDKVIEFVGKGGKIGQKLLHSLAIEALEEYFQWMRSQDRAHEAQDWIFQPTRNPSDPKNLNKPLNPKTVNEIFLHYSQKIGLNFKTSPHCARATFIGELLEVGVDIYSVAREVYHSSVTTTQEYDKRRKKISDSPIRKLSY